MITQMKLSSVLNTPGKFWHISAAPSEKPAHLIHRSIIDKIGDPMRALICTMTNEATTAAMIRYDVCKPTNLSEQA